MFISIICTKSYFQVDLQPVIGFEPTTSCLNQLYLAKANWSSLLVFLATGDWWLLVTFYGTINHLSYHATARVIFILSNSDTGWTVTVGKTKANTSEAVMTSH